MERDWIEYYRVIQVMDHQLSMGDIPPTWVESLVIPEFFTQWDERELLT